MRDRAAASPDPVHATVDRTPRRAPADNQQLGVFVALEFDLGDVLGDAGDLRGAQPDHVLVVLGVVADVARAVFLLDAADAVGQTWRAGHGPGAGERLGVAQVRPEHRIAVG